MISGAVFLLVVASSQLTRLLVQRQMMPPVRASSLVALSLSLFLLLFKVPQHLFFEAAILGGTFVGMSEEHRLSRSMLVAAAALYTLLFVTCLPLNPGYGGALGVLALVSSLLCWLLQRLWRGRIAR